MRTLDTYENVKSVILAYYQSRHVTGSGMNTGPAPMDVGAQRQTGQRYIKEKEKENCSPKEKKTAGKGYPTGKGKDRPTCWNCGSYGHQSKNSKMVNGEQEDWTGEEDWMDWTGAVTDD